VRISLFAGATELGLIDTKIIDESMGVIGGILQPSVEYFANFQPFFRSYCQQPKWEQLETFQLEAITDANKKLKCEGGIRITDVEGFSEIAIELCGIDYRAVESLLSN
jgi:hypothetical protein